MTQDPQAQRMRDHFDHMLEAHGLAVIGVGPGEGSPTFSYTLGLTAIEQPELLVFGLPPQTAQAILNDIAMPVVMGDDDATAIEPGVRRDLLANGVPLMLISANREHAHEFVTAPSFYYGVESANVLQVVWPDAQGLWPWDEGSKATYPVLGEPLQG